MKQKDSFAPLFTNTLNALSAQYALYEGQARAIRIVRVSIRALQLLKIKKPFIYEVHIQASEPSERPSMAYGTSLCKARARSIKRWQKQNKRIGTPLVEVFLRTEGLLVPLQPQDAVMIANKEAGGKLYTVDEFSIDSRMIGKVEKTVWKVGESLPGWHK